MFMDITDIDLLDQKCGMACAKVSLRCTQIFSGIHLFDQNVGMICAKARRRCLWTSLVLIYLIKMWVWHMPMIDTDILGYHWY